MGARLCMSRGPRIGGEGMPVCWQVEGHDGPHRPDKNDGWGDITWGEPRMALPQPSAEEIAARTARDAAPTPEGVVLGAEERWALGSEVKYALCPDCSHCAETHDSESNCWSGDCACENDRWTAIGLWHAARLAAERAAHEGLRGALQTDLEVLEFVGCQFWACEGPDQPPVDMATCKVCWRVRELRAALAAGVRGE